MWEFRNRNVFGATAFSTYGAFWMCFGLFVILALTTVSSAATRPATSTNAAAWFLFAFLMFNTYMLIGSMRVNKAVFAVFLVAGDHGDPARDRELQRRPHGGKHLWWLHAGGWMGIATAAVAWYTSAAVVWNNQAGRVVLPVGKPMMT